MEIAWHGYSCFRLTERNSVSIVTDPFDKSIGLTTPRLKADVVTISHEAPAMWVTSILSHHKHKLKL